MDECVDVVNAAERSPRFAQLFQRFDARVQFAEAIGVGAKSALETTARAVITALPASRSVARIAPMKRPHFAFPVAVRMIADDITRQDSPHVDQGHLRGHSSGECAAPAHVVIQLVCTASAYDHFAVEGAPPQIGGFEFGRAQIAADRAPHPAVFTRLGAPGADAVHGRENAADHVLQLLGTDVLAHCFFPSRDGRACPPAPLRFVTSVS